MCRQKVHPGGTKWLAHAEIVLVCGVLSKNPLRMPQRQVRVWQVWFYLSAGESWRECYTVQPVVCTLCMAHLVYYAQHVLALQENGTPIQDIFLFAVHAGHQRWVWDCVFSVDAAYLVTASSDCSARLWDLSTGEAIRMYSGHHKAATCCALNDSAFEGRED